MIYYTLGKAVFGNDNLSFIAQINRINIEKPADTFICAIEIVGATEKEVIAERNIIFNALLKTIIPQIDTIWEHTNGNHYKVIMISNVETSIPEKRPITVVYKNTNNDTVWNRPLSDWHRSMTQCE